MPCLMKRQIEGIIADDSDGEVQTISSPLTGTVESALQMTIDGSENESLNTTDDEGMLNNYM